MSGATPSPIRPRPARAKTRPARVRATSTALAALATVGLAACDVATIPSTAGDGLGRPAVAARLMVEVDGLPPGIETLSVDVSSLAIRRTRDRQWIPLVAGSTVADVSADSPRVELTTVALGADTYDRLEVLTEGLELRRQGRRHEADLDREDATLAIQWVFDHDVDVVVCLDYRADMDLSADGLDVRFAPLAHLD